MELKERKEDGRGMLIRVDGAPAVPLTAWVSSASKLTRCQGKGGPLHE